jgi:hypothetical protein
MQHVTPRGQEGCKQGFGGKPAERNHLSALRADGHVELKWSLKGVDWINLA